MFFLILLASGLFVASKYPVIKAEVYTFPTSCTHHQFFYPSILMLKLHLGYEKQLDHDGLDKQCNSHDSKKAYAPKHGRTKIGFVANVNSATCCVGGKNAKTSPQQNNRSEIRKVFDRFRKRHTKQCNDSSIVEGADQSHGSSEKVEFAVISGGFCTRNLPPECK